MPPATFEDFAACNDAAAHDTGKLHKQAVVAEWLKRLADDADLRRGVRFMAGRPFASTDARVLGVSSATLRDVALTVLGVSAEALSAATRRHGEIGEAVGELWGEPRPAATGPLLLADMEAAFDALATTGNQARKRELLAGLFRRAADGRQAAYLAKVILGDMRTGVKAGVIEAAVAQAFGRPAQAVRRAHLLLGDLDDVAVLARHDRLAEAAFRLFHPVQFMLATPQETAADAAAAVAKAGEGGFLCEDKFDGIRAQVHKQSGRVEIYTRTLDRIDESFPDVVQAVTRINGDVLLDGEIVPWKAGQVQAFALLQRRLGRRGVTPGLLAKYPCAFVAFDLLFVNGQNLLDEPLLERRARLEALLKEAPSGVMLSEAVIVRDESEIAGRFDAARLRRNEGLMLKDPASPYAPGRRGGAWLKLKTHLPTLDCVVTAAEYGHGRKREWLSDYTFAVWDGEPDAGGKLVNVGKAYSGTTDAQIRQLTATFLSLSREQHGRVHQVEPKVVLEIAADAIQPSDRHESGYALRFPRIKRIREDKGPEDADRLSRVAEVYQSTANFGYREPEPPAKQQQLELFE